MSTIGQAAIYAITAQEITPEHIGLYLYTKSVNESLSFRGTIDSITVNTNPPHQVAVGVNQRDILLLQAQQHVILLHPKFWPADLMH